MVREQVTAFLFTVGLGFLAGFAFDAYRVLQRAFRLKKTGTFFGDLIFCLFLTVFVFSLLIPINYGEVRFYVLLGMALGAAAYFQFFSRAGYGALSVVFNALKKIFCFLWEFFGTVWKAATLPFRLSFRVTERLLVSLPGGCQKGGSLFKKAGLKIARGLAGFLKRR